VITPEEKLPDVKLPGSRYSANDQGISPLRARLPHSTLFGTFLTLSGSPKLMPTAGGLRAPVGTIKMHIGATHFLNEDASQGRHRDGFVRPHLQSDARLEHLRCAAVLEAIKGYVRARGRRVQAARPKPWMPRSAIPTALPYCNSKLRSKAHSNAAPPHGVWNGQVNTNGRTILLRCFRVPTCRVAINLRLKAMSLKATCSTAIETAESHAKVSGDGRLGHYVGRATANDANPVAIAA
jgi:hypothetical protein